MRQRAAEFRPVFQPVRLAAAGGRTRRPAAAAAAVGTGQVKVGLILPLSAAGNAGVAAQSMKNAAEMALAEFQNPNVQLLIKDDGGSPQGAARAPSRRSARARRSFWARCLRSRFPPPRS